MTIAKMLGVSEIKEFVPCTMHLKDMDLLLYMTEDVSYRGLYVNLFLDILLHPQSNKIIGIQLHSFSFLLVHVKSMGMITPSNRVLLSDLLDAAWRISSGNKLDNDIYEKWNEQYKIAKEFVADFYHNIEDTIK